MLNSLQNFGGNFFPFLREKWKVLFLYLHCLTVFPRSHKFCLPNLNSPLGFRVPSHAQGYYLTVSSRVCSATRHIQPRVQMFASLTVIYIPCSSVEINLSDPAFEGWAQPVIFRRNCVNSHGYLKILLYYLIRLINSDELVTRIAHLSYLMFLNNYVHTTYWRQISGGKEEDGIRLLKFCPMLFQQVSFRWSTQNLKDS